MATRLCPNKIDCPGSDWPITNYSAEGPEDEQTYYSVVFPSTYRKEGCLSVCESTVSQAEADACALNQEAECNYQDPEIEPTVPPEDPNDPGSPNDPDYPDVKPLACNAAATGTAVCPDGLTFSYTVGACTIYSKTFAAATAKALALAQKLAITHRICLSDIEDEAQVGSAYASSIVATGNYLSTTANIWELVSGALPPGITFPTDTGGKTLPLTGIPTTAGTYDFSIRITAPNGDHMTKPYTITVTGCSGALQDNQSTDIGNAQLTTIYFAQAFTAGATYTCCEASLKLWAAVASTGDLQVGIYSDNAGSPGTLIGSLSAVVDASTVVTTVEDWYDFTGLSSALITGTPYWLVLKLSSAPQFVYWRRNTIAATTMKSADGTIWVPYLGTITTAYKLYS